MLRRQAGEPPTARLRPGFAKFETFCRLLDANNQDGALASLDAARQLVLLGVRQRLPDRAGSYLDSSASYAARFIAKKDVQVRCWSASDWKALTAEEEALYDEPRSDETTVGITTRFRGTRAIQLSPGICRGLKRVEAGKVKLAEIRRSENVRGSWLGIDDAQAVKTLAHEAEHAGGVMAEAVAECYALQWVPAIAVELGTDPATAREMDYLLLSHYPQFEPRGYSSPQCKRHGKLDLHLAATWWPKK